jgi:hypothetical protein
MIGHGVALGKLAHPVQDAHLARHVAVRQIAVQGVQVELSRERWVGHEGLQLGGKRKPAGGVVIEQRLFAGPVAREKQSPGAAIEQAEGEHAVEMAHAIDAPGTIRLQNDLAVAGGAERMAALL